MTVLGAGAQQQPFNALGGGDLAPIETGRLLTEVVLAGSTVGEGWGVLVSDLLEAAAVVLAAHGRLTLAELLDSILYPTPSRKRNGEWEVDADGKVVHEYGILRRLAWVERQGDPEARIAALRVKDFFRNTKDEQRRYVRQVIERSLGDLRSPAWRYLSGSEPGSIYSDVIHGSRVVSVAVGQTSPAFQRSMSTLVKAIFQQAVLADLTTRIATDGPGAEPAKPFFILACDEYAQAITEGESGLVSDSRFFSLSREAGCMSLLALQSVATGRSRFPSTMRDRWEGIMGNVTVKMFMRVNDVETAELGSVLAGSQHSAVSVLSQQLSAQGPSTTQSVTMLEHRLVPPWFLTNRLERGYALVHGTLDGVSVPTSLFVKAPV